MAVSSAPYYHGAGMDDSIGDFEGLGAEVRVGKRRRLDDGAHETVYNSWQQQQGAYDDQAHSQYGVGQPYAAAAHEASTGAGFQHDYDYALIAQQYPDVSTYQQPYFHQQTDPSTYTSSWPPIDPQSYPSSNSHQQLGVQQTQGGESSGMPLFPQTQVDTSSIYDAVDTSETTTGFQDAAPTATPFIYAYSQHANNPLPERLRQPSTYYFEDVSMHLKLQSLPILDNLATQLIQTIAKATLPQIQDLMRSSENEDSQAYVTLKSLFDQTRKVYSRETPFIDAMAIQMFQPSQQEIVRKANIATFISSILGAHDVSFFHLNEYFIETFIPLGHRLLKWQGAVYLELKTQTYISALMNSDSSPEAMLDELFPLDLDAQILTRHPDAPSLSPSEQDFIDRCRARKSYLLDEPSTQDTAQELGKRYQWNDLVREFAGSITKNVESILNTPTRAQQMFGGSSNDKRVSNAVQAVHDSAFNSHNMALQQGQTVALPAHLARQRQPTGTAVGNGPHSEVSKKSAPAALAKRQAWTKAEEEALLSGLDKVNGPHWSQILALYGRGGSVSEVLKDRNQVQLKDKARNLKLWYLKTSREVPNSLKGVTGEMTKRGGARAKAALGLLDSENPSDANSEPAQDNEIDPTLERAGNTKSKSGGKRGKKKS